MKIYTSSQKGRREKNEDEVDVDTGKNGKNVKASIMDGHGGNFVSKYLKKTFLHAFAKIKASSEVQLLIDDIQHELRTKYENETKYCGSTLLACHVNLDEGFIRTVNIGDCRALLLRKDGSIMQLSSDHKPRPDMKAEVIRMRREKCGYAKFDRDDRVWRTADGYSVSRAMGDISSPCMSQRADVSTIPLPADTSMVLLACDGVWDVLSNKDVCGVASEALSKGKNPAKAVGKLAYDKHSQDNLSVVAICLEGSSVKVKI